MMMALTGVFSQEEDRMEGKIVWAVTVDGAIWFVCVVFLQVWWLVGLLEEMRWLRFLWVLFFLSSCGKILGGIFVLFYCYWLQ